MTSPVTCGPDQGNWSSPLDSNPGPLWLVHLEHSETFVYPFLPPPPQVCFQSLFNTAIKGELSNKKIWPSHCYFRSSAAPHPAWRVMLNTLIWYFRPLSVSFLLLWSPHPPLPILFFQSWFLEPALPCFPAFVPVVPSSCNAWRISARFPHDMQVPQSPSGTSLVTFFQRSKNSDIKIWGHKKKKNKKQTCGHGLRRWSSG